MKLDDDARVVGAGIVLSARDQVTAETTRGKMIDITYQSVKGKRAQVGTAVIRRDDFVRVVPPAPTLAAPEVN